MSIEGKKELFSLHVICTHVDEVKGEEKVSRLIKSPAVMMSEDRIKSDEPDKYYCQDVFFKGYIESDIFAGTVKDGGVDHQIYKNGECVELRAEYTLEGVDADLKECSFDVVNKWGVDAWRPEIKTDAKSLSFLNGADLIAILEDGKFGPVIRFYL